MTFPLKLHDLYARVILADGKNSVKMLSLYKGHHKWNAVMHIIQLHPPIPVNTPKGIGVAWLVIDYGPEYNLLWTVAIDDTGEIWTFNNIEIRAIKNASMGRHLNNTKKQP